MTKIFKKWEGRQCFSNGPSSLVGITVMFCSGFSLGIQINKFQD